MKVLFVCTGNTCRSPMAEGLMRKWLQVHAIPDVIVESAGVSTWNGGAASKWAVVAAKELGADIASHKSRQLNQKILADADYVLVMTPQHADAVRRLAPDRDIRLLGTGITDPYGGDLAIYRRCAKQIQTGISDFCTQVFLLRDEK